MIKKENVEKIVSIKRKSSIVNHLKSSFNSNYLNGEIRNNEILIWKSTSFFKIFHSVFVLRFNSENQFDSIKTKNNPLTNLVLIILTIAYLAMLVIRFMSTIPYVAMTSSIALTIILGFIFLLVYSLVKTEKKKQTEELKSILISLENIKSQNQYISLTKTDDEFVTERGTLNTILRIILYPFSIICIIVSIFYFFPNGKMRAGIGGVLIPIMYLITDIKILNKSRKRKNS